MNWQKRHGYGLRALGKTALARVKRINGGKLTARTFQSQQNEIAIQIDALNRSYPCGETKHNQNPLTQPGNGRSPHRGSMHQSQQQSNSLALVDNRIERLSPVRLWIVHHDIHENRHQEAHDGGTVTHLVAIYCAVPGRASVQ